MEYLLLVLAGVCVLGYGIYLAINRPLYGWGLFVVGAIIFWCGLLALPLGAATETGSVTVPDGPVGVQLATALDPWVQAQKNPDETPKYPGGTVSARRGSFLDGALRDVVRRALLIACTQFPATCSTDLKAAIEGKATAESDIKTELESIIQ